jgi:hypothetical protein
MTRALTKYHCERYGSWSGNEQGYKPDPERCAYEVFPVGRYVPQQCSRARGHGPEEAFCAQHAKGRKEIE